MRSTWKSQRYSRTPLKWSADLLQLMPHLLMIQPLCQELLLARFPEVTLWHLPMVDLMRTLSLKILTSITSSGELKKPSQTWIHLVLAGSLGSWQAGRLLCWSSRSMSRQVDGGGEKRTSNRSTIPSTEEGSREDLSCGEVACARGNTGRLPALVGIGTVRNGVWGRGRTKVRGWG